MARSLCTDHKKRKEKNEMKDDGEKARHKGWKIIMRETKNERHKEKRKIN
jgi:hypothetical protein